MTPLFSVLYVVGITAESMTAALSAGRQKLDLFGVTMIASMTALGGGTVRDMILDDPPFTWVEHPIYLVIVIVAAVVTVGMSFLMHYFRHLFLILDALGLPPQPFLTSTGQALPTTAATPMKMLAIGAALSLKPAVLSISVP